MTKVVYQVGKLTPTYIKTYNSIQPFNFTTYNERQNIMGTLKNINVVTKEMYKDYGIESKCEYVIIVTDSEIQLDKDAPKIPVNRFYIEVDNLFNALELMAGQAKVNYWRQLKSDAKTSEDLEVIVTKATNGYIKVSDLVGKVAQNSKASNIAYIKKSGHKAKIEAKFGMEISKIDKDDIEAYAIKLKDFLASANF